MLDKYRIIAVVLPLKRRNAVAKYTIEFDDAFDKTLTDLKDGTDATTKADVIRRAVATYKVLKGETAKDGEIAVTDKNGNIKKSFILP